MTHENYFNLSMDLHFWGREIRRQINVKELLEVTMQRRSGQCLEIMGELTTITTLKAVLQVCRQNNLRCIMHLACWAVE